MLARSGQCLGTAERVGLSRTRLSSSDPIRARSRVGRACWRIERRLKRTISTIFFGTITCYCCWRDRIGDVQYSVTISTIVAVRAWRNSMSCPRSLQALMLSHIWRALTWMSDSRRVVDRLEKNGLRAILLDLWRSCCSVPKTAGLDETFTEGVFRDGLTGKWCTENINHIGHLVSLHTQ